MNCCHNINTKCGTVAEVYIQWCSFLSILFPFDEFSHSDIFFCSMFFRFSIIICGHDLTSPKQYVWLFANDIFKCIFLEKKIFICQLKFHGTWLRRLHSTNRTMILVMACYKTDGKPWTEPVMTHHQASVGWKCYKIPQVICIQFMF